MRFLGIIELDAAPASDVTQLNNLTTGTPFDIPAECRKLGLQPDVAGLMVGFVDDEDTELDTLACRILGAADSFTEITLGRLSATTILTAINADTLNPGNVYVFALY